MALALLLAPLALPQVASAAGTPLVRITEPKPLEHFTALSVEAVVEVGPKARAGSFQAWLNGRSVTHEFVAVAGVLRADLDEGDGLRVGSPGGDLLSKLNLLAVSVRGVGPSFAARLFLVEEPSGGVVPVLAGLSVADAEQTLLGAGLVLGNVTEAFRASVESGRTIGQTPAPNTAVAAGSGVDLVVVAEPPADVTLPPAWAGEWGIVFTYRDAATGDIDNVQPVANPICSGDPLGLAALEATGDQNDQVDFTSCTGSATDDSVLASCTGQITNAFCTYTVDVDIEMTRTGDTIVGSGAWSAGDFCGTPLASFGQTVEIEGNRSGADPTPLCTGPTSSLLQKFMRNPLILLTEGQL